MIYTLPLFLAVSNSPAEFVLNAMALIFIVTLDDIPEGKRNAYAISLAEDLDTSNPETLDPESTPTEGTVLPWGHVITRDEETGSPTSARSSPAPYEREAPARARSTLPSFGHLREQRAPARA